MMDPQEARRSYLQQLVALRERERQYEAILLNNDPDEIARFVRDDLVLRNNLMATAEVAMSDTASN